ncbi:hypothetical protein NIES2101_36940 [Calothrix sp. HK-06]|nr:hypothetical protein NIES2101_36940 [Calothrix sp. HK-06]
MIDVLMRPSIVLKLFGATIFAGLSLYNLVSSSDQVLIRSANSNSSRTEVRVFESPSRNLNLISGIAFGAVSIGLIYFGLKEYNNVVEELGDIECAMQQEEDHPQLQQPVQQQIVQPQPSAPHVVQPSVELGNKPYLRLVPPITADGTSLTPPSDFMEDMEAKDFWE